MVVSSVGYFSKSFTVESCKHYYMLPVVFKVIQIAVCQIILAIRTYSVSRKNRNVGIVLSVALVIVTALQFFTNIYGRIPLLHEDGACTSGNDPTKLVNWMFYVWAIIYDILTLSLSTYYLIRGGSGLKGMTNLVKTMVVDGLGYIVVLTAINILNLILYRTRVPEAQAAGATLGFAFTWIMSQNMLIKIRKVVNGSNRMNTVFSSSGGRQRTEIVGATTTPIELDTVQIKIDRSVEVDSGHGWGDTGVKSSAQFSSV
ncbi:hypothetical protein CYLTODRAFT_399754 [Cylindrobasidium torrendii FP15055 ss-10]|uniref:Uncharacterized protein n=1 Tax=Cylindrobasidium torrendii FP15055 ss-10 TaxID=1314674 RepID=A0A0D7B6Q8_9AGAR|nr:hypothetical protein CYLTODRAFT_399754 [Cylindrobasidium torrendii FP15055 ss-10]